MIKKIITIFSIAVLLYSCGSESGNNNSNDDGFNRSELLANLTDNIIIPSYNNFQQELINLGYDSILDDSVLIENINTVTQLFLPNRNIIDLTGIEAFIDRQTLDCNFNPGLINLDIINLYFTSMMMELLRKE